MLPTRPRMYIYTRVHVSIHLPVRLSVCRRVSSYTPDGARLTPVGGARSAELSTPLDGWMLLLCKEEAAPEFRWVTFLPGGI